MGKLIKLPLINTPHTVASLPPIQKSSSWGSAHTIVSEPSPSFLTACDQCGMRRVGRARRGGAGLSCWAITCGGGPPLKTRASCTGCACARSCGVTHGTVARACWGQRATGATLHRPWSMYATGTGPPRRPRPLGRHDERQRPEHRGASARCWYLLQGVNTGYLRYTVRPGRQRLGGVPRTVGSRHGPCGHADPARRAPRARRRA